MLSVLNRGEELGTHVRGALNNGRCLSLILVVFRKYLAGCCRCDCKEGRLMMMMMTGCSEIEIREALLQSSVYGGAPAGMTGFKIAEKAIIEWAEENAKERPIKGNGVNV